MPVAAVSMIRICKAATLVLAAMMIGAADSAQSVTINPRGLGQVLIYPYYTVNAGFSTCLKANGDAC